MLKELCVRGELFANAARVEKGVLQRTYDGPEGEFSWSLDRLASLIRANTQLHLLSVRFLQPIFSVNTDVQIVRPQPSDDGNHRSWVHAFSQAYWVGCIVSSSFRLLFVGS